MTNSTSAWWRRGAVQAALVSATSLALTLSGASVALASELLSAESGTVDSDAIESAVPFSENSAVSDDDMLSSSLTTAIDGENVSSVSNINSVAKDDAVGFVDVLAADSTDGLSKDESKQAVVSGVVAQPDDALVNKEPDEIDPVGTYEGDRDLSVEQSATQSSDASVVSVKDGWYTNDDGVLEYFKAGVASTADCVWYIDEANGERYWYENGSPVRSHAFYDSASEKWYWADEDGTVARSKDVFIPKDESNRDAGGKWVRILDDYSMRKGEDYSESKDDGQYHWWFFDEVTGEMVKNFAHIGSNGGKWVYYDDIMGWMLYGEQYKVSKDNLGAGYHWYYFDDYTGATTYKWKYIVDPSKWVYYDDVMGWMLYGDHIIDNVRRRFDVYTGACDKVGFQNPVGYYQVSSWSVAATGNGGWMSYITPSRISVDASRGDCVEAVIARAYEYVGTPYIWDYASAPGVGVDCAGLVMQCLYAAGMDLAPMTTWDHYYTSGHDQYANYMWQSGKFQKLSYSERQRGDIISWEGHVAIYIGNDQIIEAYSPATGVRITTVYGNVRGVLRAFI